MTTIAEVTRLQNMYCRAIDDRDPVLLRALLTGDVELRAANGTTVSGADAFVAFFTRYWNTAPGTGLHFVSNIEVLDEAPTGVTVHALFHAVSTDAEGQVTATWGRYRDQVARLATGELRFAAKRIYPWGRGQLGNNQ
jgi:predicted SnoaL-like aldol condensation-catalyzing enzyme